MKNSLVKLYWRDVKDLMGQVNPSLAKLIDALNPDDSLFFYKASYPFGATIVDQGLFYIPLENGRIVPINDSEVDGEFQKNMAYAENGFPAGMLTHNSYELFIRAGHQVLPVLVPSIGSFVGLWKQLDHRPVFHPVNIFNMTAGARSIFMLPNVGDVMFHHNLKRDYNVHHQPPKTLQDQWSIFKAIAEHERSTWRTELLLLPGIWFDKVKKDPGWHELYRAFLESAWHSSGYERNLMFYDYAFSCAQANQNLKPNPYLLDTVRHLIAIALGSIPGFKPATDETMGPIALFQRAYAESYSLKKYAPVIMHPAHFDLLNADESPVYYSLQFPTTLTFSPRSRQLFSTLFDLRELRYIVDAFMDELSGNKVKLETTIVGEIPKLVEFDFYHNKPDQHDEIQLTSAMLNGDPRLVGSLYNSRTQDFANSGAFVRGCVRIKRRAS